MTDDAADSDLRRRPPRRGRERKAALAVLAVAGGVAVVVVVLGYAARREIARDATLAWLHSKGVDAELRFETLTPRGFAASLRAGPQDDPDLTVQRLEVDTATAWPWAKGGFKVTPTRIRLVRPVLKTELRDGRLRFGTLDTLVQELLKRPPEPGAPSPQVVIEDGRVRVKTPYGLLIAQGGGTVDAGRIVALDARLLPARLQGRDLAATLDGGVVRVRTTGDRTRIAARVKAQEWTTPTFGLEQGEADLEAALPWPDLKTRRISGPASLRVGLRAAALTGAAAVAREAEFNLAFDGAADGRLDALHVTGTGRGSGRAAGLTAAGTEARDLSLDWTGSALTLTRSDKGLRWSALGGGVLRAARARREDLYLEGARVGVDQARFAGGETGGVEARLRARLDLDRVAQGDLALKRVRADFDTDARMAGAGLVRLTGAVHADQGGWTGLGPVTRADDQSAAALKRALADFRIDAPAVTIETGSPGTTLALNAPVRLSPRSGGVATVAAVKGAPLYRESGGHGHGALALTVSGGALPDAKLTVARYDLASDAGDARLRADLAGTARFSYGPLRSGSIDTAGRLDLAGGTVTYSSTRCTALTAQQLDLGDNDVADFRGRLCPRGEPLFRLAGEVWRIAGVFEAVEASVPLLESRVSDAAGALVASGRGEPLSADVAIASARLIDTATVLRYRPLGARGAAKLANGRWSGTLRVSARDRRVADLTLRHTVATGKGELIIDSPGLAFTKSGLQPSDFSPTVADLATDVEGVVDFTGRADWTPTTLTSSGRFVARDLAFQSAAGPVKRFATDIVLTSLAPLTSGPGQHVTVDTVQSVVPATRAEATFQLTEDALRVETGGFEALQGHVGFDAFTVPFTAGKPWEGVVAVKDVQVGPLIERTSLGDRVLFDAKLSGRLPFVVGPQGVRFIDGRLAADGPGRLSIAPSVLTGMHTGEGESAVPAGVSGLAYQALEHLAFTELEATVNSLPKGRLGVLFHIKGRHDPPQRQEIRLSATDLIKRRLMEGDLPLPSGTGVNLTLDTSWNLDELLASWSRAKADEASRSEPVQPNNP